MDFHRQFAGKPWKGGLRQGGREVGTGLGTARFFQHTPVSGLAGTNWKAGDRQSGRRSVQRWMHSAVQSKTIQQTICTSTWQLTEMTTEAEVLRLREENAHLRSLLEQSTVAQTAASAGVNGDNEPKTCTSSAQHRTEHERSSGSKFGWEGDGHDMTKEQIARYSRQIILPAYGTQGGATSLWNHIVPSGHMLRTEQEALMPLAKVA